MSVAVTIVPAPSLAHLWRCRHRVAHEGATQPWTRPGDTAVWLSGSADSLAVLARLTAERIKRAPVVWLPDLICAGALASLQATGAQLVFYPVTDAPAPHWPELERLEQPCDLLILVHWFGFVTDTAAARAFCDRRGALLVEDAAHVVGPAPGIGEDGDAVLYSPHKILGLPDGAVLVARPRAPWLAEAVAQLNFPARNQHPHGWLLKRIMQRGWLASLQQRWLPGGQKHFLSDPDPAPGHEPQGPLMWSLRLAATADLAVTARWRTDNAAALATVFDGMAGVHARHAAQPYRLILRCDTAERADSLYNWLRARHLPVESWPDLPREVLDKPCRALWLRWTHLLLPVHQGLAPEPLAAAYATAMAGWKMPK